MKNVIKLIISKAARTSKVGSLAMSIDGEKLAIINILTCEDPQPFNAIDFHIVTDRDDIPFSNVAIHGESYKAICTSDDILISYGSEKMTTSLKESIVKEFHRGVPLSKMEFDWQDSELFLVPKSPTIKEYCEPRGISYSQLIRAYENYHNVTEEEIVEE